MEIFLSGHGGWNPKDGYVTVPASCKVHFYTHFAKNLITGMEHRILAGTYTTKDRTINAYMMCPNLKLSPQDAKWTNRSIKELDKRGPAGANCRIFSPKKAISLKDLFDLWTQSRSGPAEFHWLACQTLGLNKVGGRELGLNAADFSHDPTRAGRYRITTQGPGGKVITWV